MQERIDALCRELRSEIGKYSMAANQLVQMRSAIQYKAVLAPLHRQRPPCASMKW